MRLTVIGAGYVGLVTAASFGELGHHVTCVDVDVEKVEALRAGMVTIFEPGLDGMLTRAREADRLAFHTTYSEEIGAADAVFVAVGTPPANGGKADLSQVNAAVDSLAPWLIDGTTLVMKSTVPVGTTRDVGKMIRGERPALRFNLAANPEFLRQGSAVEDFMQPDHIVIGVDSEAAEDTLRHVYQPLLTSGVATVFTNLETAELIKYATNAFLATKLSFINEIADLCERAGASIEDVALGLGLDRRISDRFLSAGPGYGGSCLPKDAQALLHTSEAYGTPSRIVTAAVDVNTHRKDAMTERVVSALGGSVQDKVVAVLGLTFKANTDDLRGSPAVDVVNGLVARRARVRAFDPHGMERARSFLPEVELTEGPYEAMKEADVLVILTEWSEFATLDLDRIKATLARPLVVDLRNLYDPEEMVTAGFTYHSVGRPTEEPAD